MSASYKKVVALLLLALLQCFAPLLHAHVHGSSASAGVHIDGVDQLLDVNPGAPAFELAQDHGPAVVMPAEFRQERATPLPDDGQAQPAAAPSPRHIALLQLQFPPASSAASVLSVSAAYSRPFSHAPPPSI
jgi:hypothetical protein